MLQQGATILKGFMASPSSLPKFFLDFLQSLSDLHVHFLDLVLKLFSKQEVGVLLFFEGEKERFARLAGFAISGQDGRAFEECGFRQRSRDLLCK